MLLRAGYEPNQPLFNGKLLPPCFGGLVHAKSSMRGRREANIPRELFKSVFRVHSARKIVP
jgi:hypothetical protein